MQAHDRYFTRSGTTANQTQPHPTHWQPYFRALTQSTSPSKTSFPPLIPTPPLVLLKVPLTSFSTTRWLLPLHSAYVNVNPGYPSSQVCVSLAWHQPISTFFAQDFLAQSLVLFSARLAVVTLTFSLLFWLRVSTLQSFRSGKR